MNKRTLFCIGEIMYINEQYHDLPLLETKEYRFISRDGQLISKQEQILKEHLIDVYLNDHLTMKLVCPAVSDRISSWSAFNGTNY